MKVLIFLGDIIFDSNNKPIGDSIKKINDWIEGGADVGYLTKRSGFVELKAIKDACKENGLNESHIHARLGDTTFVEMVETLKPAILIETSTSSEKEKTVGERLKSELKVKSVVLERGMGLDALPDKPEELNIREEEVTPEVE
jgi:hypothetical protein